MSDMDLVLLESKPRGPILATTRVTRHRRIPAIQPALRQSGCELRARLDVELAERLAQVVLDGAGADEQSRSDLAIGVTFGRKAGDLRLLRSEVVARVHGPLSRALPRRLQLEARALGERVDAEVPEQLVGGPQLLASLEAPALAP